MSRRDAQRLDDIVAAGRAIEAHLGRGTLHEGVVYDAVRMRLFEIGEAAKALSPAIRARAPQVPWRSVMAMRDVLGHRYFDTEHAIVVTTVRDDLSSLVTAAQELLHQVEDES